jgi:PAS domain S-box-containing protein
MDTKLNSVTGKCFQHSPSGLVLVRLSDRRIVAVSRVFEKLTGYKSKEVIGQGVDELDVGIKWELLERRLLGGKRVNLQEETVRMRNGRRRIYLYSSSLLEDEGERYVLTSFHDVTEYKLAEEMLRDTERTLRTMINANPQPCTLLDINAVILTANAAASQLFGRKGESLAGIKFLDLLPEEVAARHRNFFQERILDRKVVLLRETVGNKILDVYIAPIRKSKQAVTGFAVSAIDITESQRMMQEREELITKLQAALAEVKTLSGLLPICASCKRIRDDKGDWQQMEYYVSDHTDASFSHGICPECMKKLYGR